MAKKCACAVFLLALLLLTSASEAKADTIVISLSEPSVQVPLLIPAGQVITSVNYRADFTATITRPCTIADPCNSPSTYLRAGVFLGGRQIFGLNGLSGSITHEFDSIWFDNFTRGSVSLRFDTHRVSLALSNGVLSVQTAPASVPEPTTLLLLTTGLAGVFAEARRRRGVKARIKTLPVRQ